MTSPGLTPPPPPAPTPGPPAKQRRRIPVWLWVVIGIVALGVFIFLAPLISAIALVVLITGIVALAKDTPTWLRFQTRQRAVVATVVSAVVFFGAGVVTTVVYPQAAERGRQTQAAPVETPVAFMPQSEETVEPVVEEDEPTDITFTGEVATVSDKAVTSEKTALEVLATLEVKGRAPKTGFDRDQFGQRWLDVDRNGCDTRNDILARDLTDPAIQGGCKVYAGTLTDPYTGKTIEFERGQATSADVQIDHVVALSDAWQKGAQQLTADQRATFANDPLNLLAVSGDANAQKGDGDAATWLPKNKAFRCEYVAIQVSVKATYGLWVTQAEHDAIARILSGCPDQPAFTSAFAPEPVVEEPVEAEAPATPVEQANPAPAPAQPAPAPAPAEPAPAPAPVEVYYANCSAVRAAGAAPISVGQPGYGRHLDRDGDGVACE